MRNLRRGGFAGEVHLVNPHYDEIAGIRAVKTYDGLPDTPDLERHGWRNRLPLEAVLHEERYTRRSGR